MITKKAIASTLVLILSGIILGGGTWLFLQAETLRQSGRIIPYTLIDGMDVGNLSKSDALRKLEKKYSYLTNQEIQVIYHEKPVATFSSELIQLRRDLPEVVDHAYLIGRSTHAPSRYAQLINGVLGIRKFNFNSTIHYDKAPLDDFLTVMKETYEKPAKNALFTFESGKVTSFKTHEDGLQLNVSEFRIGFHQAVATIQNNGNLTIVGLSNRVLKPEVTLSQANNLGIEEYIGEGVSDYSHSIPGRIHNVKLAASKFHGVIIPKGEVLSFVKEVGDISSSTGYQPAYIIKNGRTVLGDGGGVCQVSTTLFRAALNTGLPVVERTAHAYRVSYYENDAKPGLDATIFSPSVDLKIQNDTQAAILIQTEVDEVRNILKFKMYGKKDDRKIELSQIELWDVSAPPAPLYEDDPTLPSGVVKQVDYPAWGGKARFTYKVTHEDGSMFEKTFISVYRPWQAVFLKGTKG